MAGMSGVKWCTGWPLLFLLIPLLTEVVMARIRTVKPDLFMHEELAELPIICRYLFIGMFTQADRRGRMEDRPKRLKACLLPYDDVDFDALLDELQAGGFIIRYEVDGLKLIQIVSFEKHQRFTGDEARSESKLPEYIGSIKQEVEKKQERNTQETSEKPGKERKGREEERNIYYDDSSSQASTTPLPPTTDGEPSSSEKISINEFRFLFQEATGSLMPGGCNQQASELCRFYSREQIKSAFEITAVQGGKTLKYVASVLEGKPKPDARSRDRPSSKTEQAEGVIADNVAAAVEAREILRKSRLRDEQRRSGYGGSA